MFPVQAGIPDLRVFPDPFLSIEEDRERTEKVLEVLDRLPLPELLRFYWSLSDTTPPSLRDRFTRSALLAEEKALRVLGLLEKDATGPPARRVLEIGSGTGGFLAVAAPRFEEVVGLDIAMRWLQLSRRRFRDLGRDAPPLVCACAEQLPFPQGRFDLIVMTATLEFARDPSRVLAEAARCLDEGGVLFVNTVNRFSLAPLPHVDLWGVGFLPRALQGRYVRWRRGVDFKSLSTLSYPELKRLAARDFASCDVVPGDVPDAVLLELGEARRAQVRLYRGLKRLRLVLALLRWLGPEWDVKLGKAS
jgi:ubiquinone/menaquinone biosynthesis C-methylase UbiE